MNVLEKAHFMKQQSALNLVEGSTCISKRTLKYSVVEHSKQDSRSSLNDTHGSHRRFCKSGFFRPWEKDDKIDNGKRNSE